MACAGVSDGVVLLVVWHTYPDPDDETVVRIIGARKQAVTIRLDADLVAWFRARGTHYQTEINRALRQFVTEQDNRDRA